MSEVYDCDRCGLCCKHLIVEAYALDVLREPRIEQANPTPKTIRLPVLEAMWMLWNEESGQCPFLGEDNACGIYATRPNACVGFMAGSPKCQQLRKDHGLLPLQPRPSSDTTMDELMVQAVASAVENAEEVF